MLGKEARENLRHLHIFQCSCREKKGKPITDDEKPFKIPSYPEILAMVIEQVKSLGFESIQRVSPNKANCIIRVFSTEHYKYDEILTYNIFGAVTYTKENRVWLADFGDGIFLKGSAFPIQYDKFETSRWLCQDEQIIFNHDFADFYLSIS